MTSPAPAPWRDLHAQGPLARALWTDGRGALRAALLGGLLLRSGTLAQQQEVAVLEKALEAP